MMQLDIFGGDEEKQPSSQKKVVDVNKDVNLPKKEDDALDTDKEISMEPAIEDEKVFTKENRRGRKSYKEMDAAIVHVEIPADKILFSKSYYPISEVAQWFNVNTSLIRFWENEFSILKPRKNKKGDRLFRPEDVKNLQLIYHLLRERKFSIEGARQYLKDNHAKAMAELKTVQSLSKIKYFLLELKANLDGE
ncbi:MAG: MerR family transcriptional regulator [Chitinophagaceae bacterium]